MIIRLGNFLFHFRNVLFPLVYLLLFLPAPAVLPNYQLAALLGLVVASTGQFLRAVTVGLDYIIRGGRNRQVYAERLVQGGIFAHCRNPLYVGNVLILMGVGLASNSRLFFLIGIPFFLIAYGSIIAAEENFLRRKFGVEFDDYCRRVNRLVPNPAGLSRNLAGMKFHWGRLISAEYGSAYLWLAAIILITLKNAWRAGDFAAKGPLIWGLWAALASVTVAYLLARFLKKTNRLAD